MAVQKRLLLLVAAGTSFFIFRYAPQLAIFPSSFFWNVATIFLIELVTQLCWTILVYPLCLNPLRHLPQPPVRICQAPTLVTTTKAYAIYTELQFLPRTL